MESTQGEENKTKNPAINILRVIRYYIACMK